MINKKIGLALGGGGARGVAHLGVLKHFEAIDLRPDMIAGTSAGAIVAGLYAFGRSLTDMKKDLEELRPAKFSSFRINELGLFENTNLKDLLEASLPKNAKIEDSPTPLAIHTTDIESGEGVSIQQGDLVKAILASCSVPGIYLPESINGRLLVDGGLSENVPLSSLKLLNAQIFIGVDLNGNERYKKPENLLDIISNSLDIAIDNQTKKQLDAADIKISMDLTHFNRFQVERSDDLLDHGEKAAKKALQSSKFLQTRHRYRKVKSKIFEFSPVKIPEIIKKKFKN